MKQKILIGACAVALLAVSTAGATDVTVRVEGKTANLVPAAKVTLPAADVLKDGEHPCARTSFGGALQSAVGNDWTASYSASLGTYFLTGIKGFSPAGNDYFALWVNNKYTTKSVCDPGLQEGDSVLALVDYCDYDAAAQTCKNESVLPLALSVPPKVTPGVPFTATVSRYAMDGSSAPVAGASVGAGTTDAAGNVTVTVVGAGPVALRATKDNFAGVDATTCATTGSDGLCGTTKPDTTAPAGRITGIAEQQRFAKGKGPRTLSGKVDADPSGIKGIELRLTRRDGKRCSWFSGAKEKLVGTRRCGADRATFFSVGDRADWSYLLPSRLPRGRYVLDVRVTDKAGNVDSTLQRTRNRIVFHVS